MFFTCINSRIPLKKFRLFAGNTVPVPLGYTGNLTGAKKFHGLTIVGDWYVDTLELNGMFNEMNVKTWPTDTIMKQSMETSSSSNCSAFSVNFHHIRVV